MLKKFTKKQKELLKMTMHQERYHVAGEIAEGSMGKVISQFDQNLGRFVARKTMKLGTQENWSLQTMRNMLKEVRLVSYLQHPNIIGIYDISCDSSKDLSYTMPLVEGSELSDYVLASPEEDLSLDEYIEIFIKLFETLAYTHDKGVLHLDLKPENIMLGKYGELYVVDWGNASLYNRQLYLDHLGSFRNHDSMELFYEDSRYIAGTPKYMSPEQITENRSSLTPASDIFSVGVILYEVLAKSHPFPSDNLEDLLKQIQAANPSPLHVASKHIPIRISRICQKMMAKEPGDRYVSFHEVIQDVRRIQKTGHSFNKHIYQREEIIFREGDPGDFAILILSGMIELSVERNEEKKFIANIGEGELLGELAIFTNQPRITTAKALVPTAVLKVSKEDIDVELEKFSPWLAKMLRSLSVRFIRINERLIALEH